LDYRKCSRERNGGLVDEYLLWWNRQCASPGRGINLEIGRKGKKGSTGGGRRHRVKLSEHARPKQKKKESANQSERTWNEAMKSEQPRRTIKKYNKKKKNTGRRGGKTGKTEEKQLYIRALNTFCVVWGQKKSSTRYAQGTKLKTKDAG